MSLHNDIGLLRVRVQAFHIQQLTGRVEPVRSVVVVEMLAGSEGLALVSSQTTSERLLCAREQIVVSI